MALKDLNVRIGADTRGFHKGLKDVKSGLTGLKSGLGSLIKTGLGFAGITAGLTGVFETMKAYVGLESSVTRVNSLFGDSAKYISNFASTTAEGFGMAESSAYQYAAVYGNLFRSITSSSKENANVTIAMLKASAVVASKTGRSMEDVMERIRSGLLGNTEAIEDLGIEVRIGMLETTAAFKKMAKGRSWEQLSYYEQQQIRILGILEQAHRNFGDEVQKGSAFSLTSLSGAFKDLISTAGAFINSALQPIITGLTQLTRWANAGLKALASLMGVQLAASNGAQEQADSQSSVAGAIDETTEAAKDAKRELAGFDELNILGKEATGAAASTNTPISSFANIPAADLGSSGLKVDEKLLAGLDTLRIRLKDLYQPSVELRGAFSRLQTSLSDLWNADGVQELFKRFAERKVTGGINYLTGTVLAWVGVIDMFAGGVSVITGLMNGDFKTAGKGVETIMQGASEAVEGFLVTVFGQKNVDALKIGLGRVVVSMQDWYDNKVKPMFKYENWLLLFGVLQKSLSGAWNNTVSWWDNTAISQFLSSHVAPWFTTEKWVAIMSGVSEGFKKVFKTAINSVIVLINRFLSFINKISIEIPDWVPKGLGGGSTIGFNIPEIPQLASGGVVTSGQLFLAREAGPELVGSYGGKTGVMNNEQIVEAVSRGVYDAIRAASSDDKERPIVVNLDGQKIFTNQAQVRETRGFNTLYNPAFGR